MRTPEAEAGIRRLDGRPALVALTAVVLAAAPMLATAADAPADSAVAAQLKMVLERLQQVEQRNQALEKRLQELSNTAAVRPPETAAAATPWGAASDTRLQAVEKGQQDLKQQVLSMVRPAEAQAEGGEDGPVIEGGVVAVLQNVNGGGSEDGRQQTRANYRGDVLLTLPAGSIGDAQGSAVGQLRFGQGGGVALRPTYTGAVNSTTFEAAAGSDETYAVVAQAYYQLQWPLDGGRFNDQASSRVEMNIGKMDLFGFFDQNAVAGDEGAAFLNNVFVHNPMLDSGGDIGADAYGFAPGIRLGYFDEGDTLGWGASLGVFASGGGALFAAGSGAPLLIAQVEMSPKQINGEPRGTYRAYAWTNGRTSDFNEAEQRHTGFGLSADQRFGRDWNVFGRYGHRTAGSGTFNDALTLGFEHGGRAWGRGRDAAGFALGMQKTSGGWRDATADGSLTGYAASGTERIAEVYYRFKFNDTLELTPDFQLIQRAGGDRNAPTVRLLGLRASLGF